MPDKLLALLNGLKDGYAGVIAVGGLVAVAIGFWGAVFPWLQSLSAPQLVAFSLVLALIVGMAAIRLWKWFDDRAIQKIPDLLFRLDQITLDRIEQFEPSEEVPETVLDDLASLLEVTSEARSLRAGVENRDKQRVAREIDRMTSKYSGRVKQEDAIRKMLEAGALLDEYDIGLQVVRNPDADYTRILNKVNGLKRRVATVAVGAAINRYFLMSDGLYSLLLSGKPLASNPLVRGLLPPKTKATTTMLRRTIEEQTALLILTVRESIRGVPPVPPAEAPRRSRRN